MVTKVEDHEHTPFISVSVNASFTLVEVHVCRVYLSLREIVVKKYHHRDVTMALLSFALAA